MKYGEQFEQICRTDKAAIYLRHVNGRQKSYEVIVVRVANRKHDRLTGRPKFAPCEPYECYPSSEKWGTSGWTCTTEERARAKYDLLDDKLSASSVTPRTRRAPDRILQDCVSASPSMQVAREVA